jgi:hypothetical protein
LSSVIDKSQEKIAEILDKLIIQILNPPKNKGKLFNEQKVFNSFTDLLGKIKETGKAIDIAKRFIRGYLEGKNLFEEDNKK